MTKKNTHFKRLMRWLLIVTSSLIVFTALPASAANNLLVNSGFEQGYANWDGLQDFTVTGPGHTGSSALYMEGADRIVVQQCIPISQAEWNSWQNVQGLKYINVDGWVKTNEFVERAYIEIWIWSDSTPAFPCNGAGSHSTSPVLLGNKNWTKLSEAPGAVFNPFGLDQKPAAVSISLVVEVVEGANATAAFDDLTLTNVSPGAVTLSKFTATPPQTYPSNALFEALTLLAAGLLCLISFLKRNTR